MRNPNIPIQQGYSGDHHTDPNYGFSRKNVSLKKIADFRKLDELTTDNKTTPALDKLYDSLNSDEKYYLIKDLK